MRKTGGLVRYQAPPLIWAFLIFLSSSIPAHLYPSVSIAGFDKLVHFIIYGTLCFFTYRAVRHQFRFPRLARSAFAISLLLTVLFGLIDELHQLGVPGRSCDIFDLTADFLGGFLCLLGVWVSQRLAARRMAADRIRT